MKFNFINLSSTVFYRECLKSNSQFQSLLFLATVIWAVCTFWMADKLPLVDLPQHAAQATMFKDILTNQFSWTDILSINWATPYLTSYVLVMLLTCIVSVSTAFKLMLSIGYIAFVYTCVLLRRHYKADSRLDWLFILPFFGYAYQWGFIPFVLSAPISLWFIYLADKYSTTLSKKYGLFLFVVGVILLETHGLMFLFSVGVGGCILLLRALNVKAFVYSLLPYVSLMIIFVIAYSFNSHFNSAVGMTIYSQTSASGIVWELGVRRVLQGLVYSIAQNNQSMPHFILLPALLMIMLSPWLFGLKINLYGENKARATLFVLAWLIILLVPNVIYSTPQLYQRFAIFLIPGYCFMFSTLSDQSKQSFFSNNKISSIALILVVITCWTVLSFHSYTNWQFNQSIKSFEHVTQGLEENQRTYVVANNEENNNIGEIAYIWFGLWFQAAKHGFTEPSFASMASFPIRYKQSSYITDLRNLGKLNLESTTPYRYFIVRTTGFSAPDALFQKFTCKPTELISKERWKIYDNKLCMKNK